MLLVKSQGFSGVVIDVGGLDACIIFTVDHILYIVLVYVWMFFSDGFLACVVIQRVFREVLRLNLTRSVQTTLVLRFLEQICKAQRVRGRQVHHVECPGRALG